MARESKIISVEGFKDKDGGTSSVDYVVTKLPATKGLDIQMKLMEGTITPELIKDVITSSVATGSVKLDSNRFEDYFSGRYTHLMNVYDAVLRYNFDENFTESGTVEE